MMKTIKIEGLEIPEGKQVDFEYFKETLEIRFIDIPIPYKPKIGDIVEITKKFGFSNVGDKVELGSVTLEGMWFDINGVGLGSESHFKPYPLPAPVVHYEDLPDKIGYYISRSGGVRYTDGTDGSEYVISHNSAPVYATKALALSSQAKAKLSMLMKQECFNGDWVADYTDDSNKYAIGLFGGKVDRHIAISILAFLAFQTKEKRDLFLATYKDLIDAYLIVSK